MRTNIVIDDELMRECLDLTGLRTKREVVNEALELLRRTRKQAELKAYFGKLRWEGNLDEMRSDA